MALAGEMVFSVALKPVLALLPWNLPHRSAGSWTGGLDLFGVGEGGRGLGHPCGLVLIVQ